jgi:hypothetical protein
VLIVFSFTETNAQYNDTLNYYTWGAYYYEPVDEVQMVEIFFGVADFRQEMERHRRNTFFEMPDANPVAYLFRDMKGNILRSYNLFGYDEKDFELKAPEKVPAKELRKHTSERYVWISNCFRSKEPLGRSMWVFRYADVDKSNQTFGLIDQLGRPVVFPQYTNIISVWERTISGVKKGDRWGGIDINGNVIVDFKYDTANVSSIGKGVLMMTRNNKVDYYDYTGTKLNAKPYDFGETFWSRRARVQRNGKYGFIDSTGAEVVPLIYDYAETFYYNVAVVKLNGKYGLVDNRGTLHTEIIYDQIIDIFDEKELVTVGYKGRIGNNWYYFNREGKPIEKMPDEEAKP